MGYAVQGHPRRASHSGDFRLNAIHLEQELAMPLQYLCQECPMIRNKRLKDMMLEDGPLRSEGVQHATEEERRTRTSSSTANEVAGPKPKGRSTADAPGSERKV